MESAPFTATTQSEKRKSRTIIFALLLLSLVAGLAAINRDSLWIDEGNAAFKACLPTFGQWVEAMRVERGSDAQMPLYMGWLWAWEKGFGSGERALRLANLPWLLLGHAFLLVALSRSRLGARIGPLYILLAATAPFLCYYLNEARPYAMEYAGGCLVLAYLLEVEAAPRRALAPGLLMVGVLGMLILAGGSLLGVPWAGSAFLAACWMVWRAQPEETRDLRLNLSALAVIGGLVMSMGLLGFYYLRTLKGGAGASAIGKTDWMSCLFTAYETAGLAGLGPNRAQLRDVGVSALLPYGFPLAAGGFILFGSMLAGGVVWTRKSVRKLPPVWGAIAWILPIGFTLALGVCGHFRVLARHCMPGFPFLLLLAAVILDVLLRTPLRGLVVLWVASWIASSTSLRFSPTHQKDNYRASAAIAQKALASGKRVWWAADKPTGRYYGLDADRQSNLEIWANPLAEALNARPEPDMVILSKRDIYDNAGVLAHYLSAHGFSPSVIFSAFTIFEKRR